MKDRLLDLLSREEEEESHGEDVVRAAFNPSLVNLPHRVLCKWSVQIESNFTHSEHAYKTLPYPYPLHTSMQMYDCVQTDSSMPIWQERLSSLKELSKNPNGNGDSAGSN